MAAGSFFSAGFFVLAVGGASAPPGPFVFFSFAVGYHAKRPKLPLSRRKRFQDILSDRPSHVTGSMNEFLQHFYQCPLTFRCGECEGNQF